MAAADLIKRMRINYGSDEPPAMKRLDSGGAIFAPFMAEFAGDRVRLRLAIDVANGTPICVRYEVERLDGGGLELMTTEIMRGLNLRNLMANACARVAMERADDSSTYSSATTVEAVEAVIGPIRRRRAPITDDALRSFATNYERSFEPGRMQQFAEHLGYSERQAWRLLKLARDRGFLDDPRKAE